MEYSEIKQIMKDMENSSLAELCIEFPDGTKINLKNKVEEKVIADHKTEVSIPVKEEIPKQKIENINAGEDLKIVTSPMVGTFYAKSSPNASPFVEIGKSIKRGETLCIIEAMKLMNEIESEYDGEIAEILVKDRRNGRLWQTII